MYLRCRPFEDPWLSSDLPSDAPEKVSKISDNIRLDEGNMRIHPLLTNNIAHYLANK